MNNTRKEFEEWCKLPGFNTTRYTEKYLLSMTEMMWEVWKASRKNITIELPENCKGKALTVDELKVMLDKVGIELKGE
jgi:diphthamide synthase subunit DPH2